MLKGDMKSAGVEFEKLAEKRRDAALREEAQKQHQQLAEQLRQAGSGITGENQTGAMQQLGQNNPQGQNGQNQQNVPQTGQQQDGQGQQQQQQMLAPPGIGQQQQQNQMQQPQGGQGQLRAVDKYGLGFNKVTLEMFTRDVYLYTRRAGLRDDIDAIVAAKLTVEPTVVVGHSLGSVVAFSVLGRRYARAARASLRDRGLPARRARIRDQFIPLRSPKPVAGWYNAYDTRDTVALYPLDVANFPIQPAVVNYDGVRNPTDNHHGIVGYLDAPDVAKHILDALGA